MRNTLRSARTVAGLTPAEFASMSPRHQGWLLRGIRGGDENAPTLEELLEQAAPDKAAELDDAALASLHDRIVSEAIALVEDPANMSPEDLALAQRCEVAKNELEAIQDTREAEATARTEEATALLKKLKGEDGDDDGEKDDKADDDADDKDDDKSDDDAGADADKDDDADKSDDDADDAADKVDDAAEKIAASKAKKSVVAGVRPRSPRFAPRKRSTVSNHSTLRASSNCADFGAGEMLDTPEKRSLAVCSAVQDAMGHQGPRVKIPVMTLGDANAENIYGADRYLDDNERGNERKIKAVTSYSALKASGGSCAPVPVEYTFPVVGTDDRPVFGSLARFGADRAGVRLIPPPVLSDVAAGTAQWTMDNDITPSSPSTKPCVTMTCPDDVETLVYAITQCIKIGNFRAKYFSEQVDAWIKEAGTWTARFAERKILTTMGGLMTNISVGSDLGTTRSVLAGLDRAGPALRQPLRLPWDFPLHFTAPGWLLDNMIADLSREMPGASTERLAMADAEIERFFTSKQINVTWALDGESGQEFVDQVDGALQPWPSHAVGYLYIEGQLLGLDGGIINLGIVRDSTLVGTNDAIMFSEFMENVAFHGNKAFRMDFDICPSGATSNAVTFDPCTTGS